jgi:metallophosphoesterase superfamily enzyme
MECARALVAADAHFGYEEVIGGALPLWSTADAVATLLHTARRMQAREMIFLGDIIHGSRMSDGAARTIADALNALRAICTVTAVAGNHEGGTRGTAILGTTHEAVERDRWTLLHGDEAHGAVRRIIGHLHPSLPLGGGVTAPAFVSSPGLIVVPALTPYSPGLNVLSSDASRALRAFEPRGTRYSVVASLEERVYPFGFLDELRSVLR